MCCFYFLDYETEVDKFGISTPVKVPVLRNYLKGYDDEDFILKGFTKGFSLGIVDKPELRSYCKIYPVKDQLKRKIEDEVQKGRIIGPFKDTPIQNLTISPVCVIPKPNSEKVRMIFNLSEPKHFSVNDNIKAAASSVEYCSVTDVVKWIMGNDDMVKEGWYMAKVDLTDAYRMVPINKNEWKYLGMRVGEDIYIDRCLPMGASSSCQTFQKISDSLTWIAMTSCPVRCHIFNYLDDFLLMARDYESCEMALSHFIKVCDEIGVPIAPKKTVHASQRIVFLGIGIDSHRRLLFIPADKASKTLGKLTDFLKKNNPTVGEWQSTLGKLCYLTQVITAGKPFLSSLYSSLHGVLSKEKHRRRRIGKEAREDLLVWVDFLKKLPPNKSFRMFDETCTAWPIYTDASKTIGYGAVSGTEWFAGKWPNNKWMELNICVLELYPVLAALHVWKEQLADRTVNIFTDNNALVYILNRLYTRDKMIRWLLKPLAMLCLKENIHIVACHVAGKDNIGPDMLSRDRVEEFRRTFDKMKGKGLLLPAEIKPDNLIIPEKNKVHGT